MTTALPRFSCIINRQVLDSTFMCTMIGPSNILIRNALQEGERDCHHVLNIHSFLQWRLHGAEAREHRMTGGFHTEIREDLLIFSSQALFSDNLTKTDIDIMMIKTPRSRVLFEKLTE
jgi:hypothetical protein